MLRGKWWEIFQEPELNGLEEQLNIDNQNIKQAFENFMAARALIREARAQYFPTVTTAPSYSRSLSSSTLAGQTTARGATVTFAGQQSTLYSWACRHLVGARPVGQSSKHGARISIRSAAQRRRS
jgi:outer membrane protein TolC